MTSFDAKTLADIVGGELRGENLTVTRLLLPEEASAGAVVVLDNPKRLTLHPEGLLVVATALLEPHPTIVVTEPRLALARLSQRFNRRPAPARGVSPQAHVHETASLETGVSVAAGAVIGAHAHIGEGSIIGANSVIGEGTRLGRGCLLYANVTLYDGVTLGERVTIHSGSVIGSDGFGFAPSPQGAVKIAHTGGVEIGDDVELGANCCVDRGTLGATRIGARTKIDNLCQVGHNAQIGMDCLIAGTTAVAGSTVVGRGVRIAGGVGISDHLHIGDGAQIAVRACVTKDVPAGEIYAGFPAKPYKKWVRDIYLMGQLERIWAFVKGQQ